ncbi:MAG: hypothetical protein ACYTG6_06130 [Planctomycetota bacterium]|jgi:hypothetical protein
MARRRAAFGLLTVLLGAGLATGRPADELPPPPAPDLAFFSEHIAPWMEAACAACHRNEGGDFRMAPGDAGRDDARRRLDFQAVLPFVNSRRPRDSALLRKVLHPAEGGDPHAGGVFLAEDDDQHDLLLDFLHGATLDNLPPEAWLDATEVRTRPGEEIVLDGSYSYDRDRDDELSFRWEVYAVPPGAAPQLSDLRSPRLGFTAKEGGSYVLRLRVGDGKAWSVPVAVTVEVLETIVEAPQDPGELSGLDAIEGDRLRRIRRLYLDLIGRSPTVPEALAADHTKWERLVASLLVRPEAWRFWYEAETLRLGLVGDARPVGEDAAELALRLAAEGTPPPRAEAVLVRDPAFLVAHPPGRALADAVARLLLGRQATAAEVTAALQLASGRPAEIPGLGVLPDARAWVLRVLASDAFAEAAVRRRLSRFLASGDVEKNMISSVRAARDGAAAWRKHLDALLNAPVYRDRKHLRPKGDLTFLRSLFIDLLGRRPTEREWYALWQALRVLPGGSAPSAAVVKILLDSGEVPLPLLVDIRDPRRWIADRFLRYLGRSPTAAEMQAYGEALLHPAGGPELLVRALLTGPEYACR